MPIEVELVGLGANWAAWVHASLTLAAILVAIFLPRWQLRQQRRGEAAALEKRHVVAMQSLYHETRLLQHFFNEVLEALQSLDDLEHSEHLRKMAHGEHVLSQALPRSVVEGRYHLVADLHIDSASLYTNAIARFYTIQHALEAFFPEHRDDPGYPPLAYDPETKAAICDVIWRAASQGYDEAAKFAESAQKAAPSLRALLFKREGSSAEAV